MTDDSEPDKWGDVYRRSTPELQEELALAGFKFAVSQCRNADQALDYCQEAIRSLLESSTACVPPDTRTLARILFTTVSRKVIDGYRAAKSGAEPIEDDAEFVDDDQESRVASAEQDEEMRALFAALLELTEHLQVATPAVIARLKAVRARERLNQLDESAKEHALIDANLDGKGRAMGTVQINVSAAARATGFTRKKIQHVVDQFALIRKKLNIHSIAELRTHVRMAPPRQPTASTSR